MGKTNPGVADGPDFVFFTDVMGPLEVTFLSSTISLQLNATFRVATYIGRDKYRLENDTKTIPSTHRNGLPDGIIGLTYLRMI